MPNYLDLVRKRIAGENRGPAATATILVDHEQHLPLRKVWEQARQAREIAEARLAEAQAAGGGGKRRMNQPSPSKQAADDLAEALQGEKLALAAVRGCFLTVHFSAPTPAEGAMIRAASGDDMDAMYDALTRACLVKVTDHNGDAVEEITGDILADFLQASPVGERAKVIRALDSAVAAVDYPT